MPRESSREPLPTTLRSTTLPHVSVIHRGSLLSFRHHHEPLDWIRFPLDLIPDSTRHSPAFTICKHRFLMALVWSTETQSRPRIMYAGKRRSSCKNGRRRHLACGTRSGSICPRDSFRTFVSQLSTGVTSRIPHKSAPNHLERGYMVYGPPATP